jgi:hypothetical protein
MKGATKRLMLLEKGTGARAIVRKLINPLFRCLPILSVCRMYIIVIEGSFANVAPDKPNVYMLSCTQTEITKYSTNASTWVLLCHITKLEGYGRLLIPLGVCYPQDLYLDWARRLLQDCSRFHSFESYCTQWSRSYSEQTYWVIDSFAEI